MQSRLGTLSAALLLATAGCSSLLDSTMNSAGSTAGNRIGSSIGDRAGNAIAPGGGGGSAPSGGMPAGGGGGGMASMPPQVMAMYTQQIFGLAFSSGGYAISSRDYKPGEYTRFSMPGSSGAENTIERAHLFDDASGNQWWKVKFTDGHSGDTTILEGLLNPATQRMVRLRGKFPKDDMGKEMPVDEQSYYSAPRRLSKESLEGAVVGTETVTTPAGTFSARHVVFGDVGSTHEWWIADSVPGGAVKQALKSGSHGGGSADHGNYVMSLVAFGANAQTELGTK